MAAPDLSRPGSGRLESRLQAGFTAPQSSSPVAHAFLRAASAILPTLEFDDPPTKRSHECERGTHECVRHTFVRASRTAACILLLTAVAQAATVNGRVELVLSQDPNVRKHLDYSGVVVWLEPVSGAPAVPVRARHAEMVQKNKAFTPHVLAIPVGTTVDFPNYDPIFHNAFSNYNGQIFDIGLYPPGATRSIAFRRPGVVRVFCNIHPAMSAVILVLKSQYFGVSNKNGVVQITGVPPGSYRVQVFHERATEQTLAALTRTVEISEDGAQLPPISVSESGYLQLPHKNKFGKDYPPATDSGGYVGTRP